MLREARKNTPFSVQKQGVWPRCGQETSRWVGLTYKVNSSSFTCVFMFNDKHGSGQNKNMLKVLDPGLKSPEQPSDHDKDVSGHRIPTILTGRGERELELCIIAGS